MQIIIPMSGEGARFKAYGYKDLKPLIKINNKPIVEYVVDLFPGEHDFIFICREDHIQQYDLKSLLNSLAPGCTIVGIKPHKLGPVYAVLQAEKFIKDESPVIVSYCDYFMNWDYNDFKNNVSDNTQDGNVICYTGFHPHLLHEKNVYAGCLRHENGDLKEIREKFSFEADKTKGSHSVGMYYFKSGELLKHYFKKTIDENVALNGEFYVSLVYPLMIRDHLKIGVYDKVMHFCQWGTPEDLEEFLYWQSIFKHNKK